MNQIEKEIYKLIFSPILTPKNLVDNIHLKNYESIKYFKIDGNVACKIKCTLEHGDIAFFVYHFSEKDFLDKIYRQLPGHEPELVFDRAEKLELLSKKINKKRKVRQAV